MSDLIFWYDWSSALVELEVFLYSLTNKGFTCQKSYIFIIFYNSAIILVVVSFLYSNLYNKEKKVE